MSRIAYAIAGVVLAAGLGAVAYAQQPGQPPFATTRVEGTENVYIFRAGNHQSMFVVTTAGVIVSTFSILRRRSRRIAWARNSLRR